MDDEITRKAPRVVPGMIQELQEFLVAGGMGLTELLRLPRETVDWILHHRREVAWMLELLVRHAQRLHEEGGLEIATARRFLPEVSAFLRQEGWTIETMTSVAFRRAAWSSELRLDVSEVNKAAATHSGWLTRNLDEGGVQRWEQTEAAWLPRDPLIPGPRGPSRQMTLETFDQLVSEWNSTMPFAPIKGKVEAVVPWFSWALWLSLHHPQDEMDSPGFETVTKGRVDGYPICLLSAPRFPLDPEPGRRISALIRKEPCGTLPSIGVMKCLVPAVSI